MNKRMKYQKSEKGKIAHRKANATYAKKHQEKIRAKWKVKEALKSGKLTRQPCEVCGVPNTEAHHDDYSKPLDVRWLCQKHHNQHHSKYKHEGKII